MASNGNHDDADDPRVPEPPGEQESGSSQQNFTVYYLCHPVLGVILGRTDYDSGNIRHCLFFNFCHERIRMAASSMAKEWKSAQFHGFPLSRQLPDFWAIEASSSSQSNSTDGQWTPRAARPHRRVRDVVFLGSSVPLEPSADSEDFWHILSAGEALGHDVQSSQDSQLDSKPGVEVHPGKLPPGTVIEDSPSDSLVEEYPIEEDSDVFNQSQPSSEPYTSKKESIADVLFRKRWLEEETYPKRPGPARYWMAYFPRRMCSLLVNAHLASCLVRTLATNKGFRCRFMGRLRRRLKAYDWAAAFDMSLFHEVRSCMYLLDVVAVYPVQRMDYVWDHRLVVMMNRRRLIQHCFEGLEACPSFPYLIELFASKLGHLLLVADHVNSVEDVRRMNDIHLDVLDEVDETEAVDCWRLFVSIQQAPFRVEQFVQIFQVGATARTKAADRRNTEKGRALENQRISTGQ